MTPFANLHDFLLEFSRRQIVRFVAMQGRSVTTSGGIDHVTIQSLGAPESPHVEIRVSRGHGVLWGVVQLNVRDIGGGAKVDPAHGMRHDPCAQ